MNITDICYIFNIDDQLLPLRNISNLVTKIINNNKKGLFMGSY